MKIFTKLCLLITGACLIAACTEDSNEKSGGHVWQEQTDTIERAKQVEAEMLNATDAAREAIDRQSE